MEITEIAKLAFEPAIKQPPGTYDALRLVSEVTSRIFEYAENREFFLDYEAGFKSSFRKHFPQTPLKLDVDMPYIPMVTICTYRIRHLLAEETKKFWENYSEMPSIAVDSAGKFHVIWKNKSGIGYGTGGNTYTQIVNSSQVGFLPDLTIDIYDNLHLCSASRANHHHRQQRRQNTLH